MPNTTSPADQFRSIEHSTKETAQALRCALRERFAGVKFSVRMSRGTGYGWLGVSWTDGPTARQVRAVTEQFESRRFNGMTDGYDSVAPNLYLIDGEPTVLRYSCCGVNTHRNFSAAAEQQAADWIAADPGIVTATPWDASPVEQQWAVLHELDLTRGFDAYDTTCEECWKSRGVNHARDCSDGQR